MQTRTVWAVALSVALGLVGCGAERIEEVPRPTPPDLPSNTLMVVTQSLPPAVLGSEYSQQLAHRGGTAPLRWSVEAPSFPWLSIDASGRLFSVTPPSRATPDDGDAILVKVVDALGKSDVRSLRIRVDCVDGQVESCFAPESAILACVVGQSRCVAGRPTACETRSPWVTSTTTDACDADCRQCDGSSANLCRDGRCACGSGSGPCARGDGGLEQCCGDKEAAACVGLDDLSNCGSCGNDCTQRVEARQNVVATCSNSQFQCDFRCQENFGNCSQPGNTLDGNAAAGCPDDLRRVETCGSDCKRCGVGPTEQNVHATCSVSGECGTSCNEGFANCYPEQGTGCQTPLNSVAHCGACNRACPAGPNAPAECRAGNCQLACPVGLSNCDGLVENGCEANLNSERNCGSCGRTCTGDTICRGGSCVPRPNLPKVCPPGKFECEPGSGVCLTVCSPLEG